jgi:hypothetical protein
MSKANNTAVTKITSVEWIKPNSKNNKKVVKPLEEWAAKILCWDNDYVKTKQLQIGKQRNASIEQKHMDRINMLC